MKKRKLICSMAMAVSIFVTGCGGDIDTNNPSNVNSKNNNQKPAVEKTSSESSKQKNIDLLKTLNESKEIVIKKAYYSLGAEYSIYVEGNLVGKVKGNPIKIKGVGDVFKMEDLNGNVVKQEEEVPKWGRLSRLAVISKPDGTTTGYIGEEYWEDLFEYGYKFHIYDKDKNEIGYTKQNLTLAKEEFEVFDMEGNEDYDIEKQLFETTATYKMKVKDTTEMSVEDIVFFVTIQDAIMSAVNDSNKNNTVNSKSVNKINNVVNTNNKQNDKKTSNSSNKNVSKTNGATSGSIDLNKEKSTSKKNNTVDLKKTNSTTNNKISKDKNTSNKTNGKASSSNQSTLTKLSSSKSKTNSSSSSSKPGSTSKSKSTSSSSSKSSSSNKSSSSSVKK